jgi:hypothetical protein
MGSSLHDRRHRSPTAACKKKAPTDRLYFRDDQAQSYAPLDAALKRRIDRGEMNL